MDVQAISAVFDLNIQDDDLEAAITTALGAIETVHAVPIGLPRIPIHEIGGERIVGGYRSMGDGTAVDVLISRDADDPGFTLAHELGHYLDHQALGAISGEFASASDELADLLESIDASDACEELRGLEERAPIAFPGGAGVVVILDRDDFSYLLEPEELFARSYAQYIAVRSGDAALLEDLLAGQRIVYPEQWEDRDFEAVGAAFDQLMEGLGWSGS